MLFNSLEFVFIFLPVALVIYHLFCSLRRPKEAMSALAISSLIFYGYWDIRFVPLLLGSIFFNFGIGKLIHENSATRAKAYLTAGLIIDIGLLFYCKYINFFLTSLTQIGIINTTVIETILPLGISFFTFTQIAYLVDVYNKKTKPCDFLAYTLFVTIFPHLIAGPVLHHKEMITQFNDQASYRWSVQNFAQGWFLFSLGLAKKVLIADKLAQFVHPVFDYNTEVIYFIQAWFGAICYTMQLYFDFSGYSDMAVGLGLMFNIHLPINFNAPYQATSIIDFWRRWHISLSNFLRDYLYIPLGGNRGGEYLKMRNLMLTMILGGIWHGAGLNFVVWGFCHGSFLVINHQWRKLNINMPALLSQAMTLVCVVIAWVIFRSPDMDIAFKIIKGMVGVNGIVLPEAYATQLAFLQTWGVSFMRLPFSNFRLIHLAALAAICLFALLSPNSNMVRNRFYEKPLHWGIACGSLLYFVFAELGNVSEFLYYQF